MSQIAVKIKDRANWIFFGDLFSLNDSVSEYSFAVPFIPIRGPTAENQRAGAGVPRRRARTGACLALADNAQRDETRRQHTERLLSAFRWKTIDRLLIEFWRAGWSRRDRLGPRTKRVSLA